MQSDPDGLVGRKKGIVYRMSDQTHQRLRELAFEKDCSIQKILDESVASVIAEEALPPTLKKSEIYQQLTACRSRGKFRCVLADPPWQFANRTGKVAPEHKRLNRYRTMSLDEIAALPVSELCEGTAHLYLWVPNALLPDGLRVLQAWGFQYKSNIVWHKIRKDGGSDGRGVGFYFRNVTEVLLFGVRGKNARTLPPGRRQVNMIQTRKREHSRKPDEQYALIEQCSPGPYLELFSRGTRKGWTGIGDQADETYSPTWKTYKHHSGRTRSSANLELGFK